MHRIPPYPLWLGHADDGRTIDALFREQIEAVFYLAAEEPPVTLPRDRISCRFPLLDGSGNPAELLSLAIRTLGQVLELRIPTLVTCGAGLSRSPAIAAAALALITWQSPEACLQMIAQHHPVDVSPGLWRDVVSTPSDRSPKPYPP